MTGLLDDLMGQIGGEGISNLSQQLGLNEQQTSSAVSAALPVLLGAMAKKTETSEGANQLAQAVTDDDGGIMDDLMGFLGSSNNGNGADILSSLLGGKQSNVENGISKATGLDLGQSMALLQNLAPILMGFLGKKQSQDGFGASVLTSILSGAVSQKSGSSNGGSIMDIAGAFLDQDGDGSAIDDIGGLLGGFLKK
ncbi:MAG: DUF937 domain-containing protein [Bacteroidota bacterium]